MSAKFNKNGIVSCTPIDGYDKVSILINNFQTHELESYFLVIELKQ